MLLVQCDILSYDSVSSLNASALLPYDGDRVPPESLSIFYPRVGHGQKDGGFRFLFPSAGDEN